jgi:hypothetical protein
VISSIAWSIISGPFCLLNEFAGIKEHLFIPDLRKFMLNHIAFKKAVQLSAFSFQQNHLKAKDYLNADSSIWKSLISGWTLSVT